MRAGKTALAAHAMVNAIFAGRIEHIRIHAKSPEREAAMMEAFYREWDAQMWSRALVRVAPGARKG